jgi:UDP:flavonoid glycosyltransferase YjiC (YdhE family)
MANILVYTSPARGHLFPLVPTLQELRGRGHHVAVRTFASEVERMRVLGFAAAPIDSAIEAREIDDWKAKSPPEALQRATRTFVDRARHEIADLRRAAEEERADVLFTDVNSWGAAAAAEASSHGRCSRRTSCRYARRAFRPGEWGSHRCGESSAACATP